MGKFMAKESWKRRMVVRSLRVVKACFILREGEQGVKICRVC